MFKRAPKPADVSQAPKIPDGMVKKNIETVLKAVEYDPLINRRANFYTLRDEYKQKGIDLEALYKERAVTSHHDDIVHTFVTAKDTTQISTSALMETLPLFANKPGRLGEYIDAFVTKTARQDDQGNSFIDLILSINNTWVATDAPKDVQNSSPAKMTFLVDTTAAYGDALTKKMDTFQQRFLRRAEKANVLAYKAPDGTLGLTRPKIIVAKNMDYVEQVGGTLGDCVLQEAGDKFTITQERRFDEEYRKYFQEFVAAIGENAATNISYLKSLPNPNEKHIALTKEYEKIVAFVEAYKKTPTTKPKA